MEFKISILSLYLDFFEFVQLHQKNPLSRNLTSDLNIKNQNDYSLLLYQLSYQR
jgi:hypothetical protein